MAQGSSVRNRSEAVTVETPRGPVEVVRQEMRGVHRRSGWHWFWLARRSGKANWAEGSTAQEAIRRATLLPARKLPAWVALAAARAEALILKATDRGEARD